VGTPLLALAQAEERKDRQDHHDQADEIDQPIHVGLREVVPSRNPNSRKRKTFLSRVADAPRTICCARARPHPLQEPPTRPNPTVRYPSAAGFFYMDWPGLRGAVSGDIIAEGSEWPTDKKL
jgi:hypothetical protein